MVMQWIRMHEVQIPINIDVGTNAARNMDSNAREYVFDARGVGSSVRMCGLKMDKAQRCGLECTRCRLFQSRGVPHLMHSKMLMVLGWVSRRLNSKEQDVMW
jgi:hypothetical protein